MCATFPEAMRLFFPGGHSYTGAAWDKPIRVCRRCPVRQECLDDALSMEGAVSVWYRHGVFGGTAPQERYAMSVKQRSSASGLPSEVTEPPLAG